MRLGPEGRKAIKDHVRFLLKQRESGVPDEGLEVMFTSWVIGLLENQTPELLKELEK